MSRSEAMIPTMHRLTVVGMSALVFAIGLASHELAHAIVASLHGADPQLVSSTDMRGDMSALGRVGTAWTAAAGSLANWTLAFIGLWILHAARTPSVRTFGWIVAAVNGLIPSMYMIASPLLGFGDWMTAIARFDAQPALRLAVGATGAGLLAGWARVSGRGLVRVLVPLRSARRQEAAARLTRTVWLAGGSVAVAAAFLSPLGLVWSIPIAIGSTLGTTWPLIPIGQIAGARGRDLAGAGEVAELVSASPAWIAAGAIAAAAFVWFLGRGIPV